MVYKEQVSRENLYVDPAAATSRTVALAGTGFPGPTELLVALVNVSTSTAIATPAGWTASGVGGANGNNQMRMFFKQGDGATNSITIESVSAIATVGIFVAAGYAGMTPIISGGANGGTGTQFPFSGIGGQPGNGLTILGIGLATAPSSWSTWSASTPILASQPSSARGWWGISDYIDGQGSPNSTVTWLGSRSQRYIAAVIPLQVAATNPTGSAALTGSGSLGVVVQPQGAGSAALGGSGELAATAASSGASSASLSGAGQLSAATAAQVSAAAALSGSGQLSSSVVAAARQGAALSGSGDLTTIAPSSGTTVPTQAEMPAAPFDLYPAPTYSWGSGAAPSGAGYTLYGPSSPMVRAVGHAGKGTQPGTISGFVNPAPLQDIAGAGTGTNPLVYPPFGERISTDAAEVWVKVGQRPYAGFSNVSARAASRLKVNGKMTSLTPVYLGANLGMPANPDNLAAGEYWLKMTFPSSEMRDLEFTSHLEFGGFVVPAGSTVKAPPSPKHRIVVLDGSLTGAEKHQTGNFALTGGSAGTYTAVSSHLFYAAQILAYDDVINSATGSTGYSISGDTVSIKSTSKLPRDAADHNPATGIIGGPNNDISAGQSVAQIEAALDIIMPNAKALMPSTLWFIQGAFTAPAMGSQASAEAAVAAVNAAIKAKAQQYGFWFINPTTGETYDPQGVLRKKTSNWVYQDTSSISSDGVHPTQDGARKLGIMLADAMMPAHASGAVEGSAPLTGSGQLTAAGSPSQSAGASLTGSGQLAAAGSAAFTRGASLTGSGSLGVVVTAATSRAVGLSGSGALSTAGTPSVARGAGLGGSGALSVVADIGSLSGTGFEDGVNPFTMGPTNLDTVASGIVHSGSLALAHAGSSSLAHRVRIAPVSHPMGSTLRAWVRVGTGSPSLAGVSFVWPDTDDNVAVIIDTRNASGSSAGFQITENRQTASTATTGVVPSQAIAAERWYLVEASYGPTAVTASLILDDGVTVIATARRVLTTLAAPTSFRPALYSYNTTWHDDVSVSSVAPANPSTSAGLTGSGSLQAGGTPASSGSAALSGSGGLGVVVKPATAAAGAFNGSGTLQAASSPAASSSAALTGSGQLASVARPSAAATAALSGSGQLGSSTSGSGSADVMLGGSGALSVASRPAFAAAVLLSGSGQLTASAIANAARLASLSGDGQLLATVAARAVLTAALAGSGQLTGAPQAPGVDVAFTGGGSLTAVASATIPPPRRYSRVGSLIGSGDVGPLIT